jgi:hypothetical protein
LKTCPVGVFRSGLQKALKAVGGLLPTRLGASPVLAGLVPAIHAAPPQRRVQAAPHVVAMASETTLFCPHRPLPSFSAPKRVGSRDKPGHDASGSSRAATTCRISCQQLTLEEHCKGFSKTEIRVISLPISRTRRRRWRVRRQGEWSGRTRLRASGPQPGTRVGDRRDFFIWIRRNALKSPISAKGMQGNASDFPWISLDLFARRSRLSCILASIGPDWSH